VIEFACGQYRKLFPKAKRVAMIGNAAEPYVAATLRDHLPAGFKRHGFDLAETVEITTAQIDYASAVNRLTRIQADIYFVQAIAGELVSIAREIARQDLASRSIVAGLQGPWAGPWLRLNPDALDKWYAVGFFNHASDRKEVRTFLAKLGQAYGDATAKSISVEASAYDTLHILATIMKNARIAPNTALADARAQIRDGLAKLRNYQGVSGTLSMNADGDSEGIQFSVFRAQKGNWVAV
jgi:branched-chain amino acid transport system substrate-binding protein